VNFFYRPGDKVSPSFYKFFNRALSLNYFYQGREWNYKNIDPKIIIEKSLVEPGSGLVDYRFLCFDGKVKMLFIDIETAALDGSHDPAARRNIYDRDFNIIDAEVGRKRFDPRKVSKPENYYEMVDIAETLSAEFAFCRVDLYNLEGKIYFGEITFYPGGCTQRISPNSLSLEMGAWIDLKSDKILILS
jgi:hypothetical protein